MYKLIVRTDDVGYSNVCNIGTFEVYDHGYGSHLELMLESPGTVDALERAKRYPWASTGWHPHFWGAPVLPAEEVPSLVIPETGRFRHDIRKLDDIDYDEILAEMRAQLDRCVHILGKAPDVGGGPAKKNTPFERAMEQVTREYGMIHSYAHRMHVQPDGSFINDPVDPRWESANIYQIDQGGIVAYDLIGKSFIEQQSYDGVAFLLEDRMRLHDLPEGSAIIHGWHPGYVDYYVGHEGDYGPNMAYYTVSRTFDTEALCSKRLHDWIKDNDIMLCSLTDALFGTFHYQNHLRDIGSDLCVL